MLSVHVNFVLLCFSRLALKTKTTFSRFMNSMLQKTGKLRGLIRELNESYKTCASTPGNLICKCIVRSFMFVQHIYIYRKR